MSHIPENLKVLANRLEEIAKRIKSPPLSETIPKLRNTIEAVGRAWSGSFIGYHSLIYYENLEPVPPGAHFSPEWGTMETFSEGTTGNWMEYSFDGVIEIILERAGISAIASLKSAGAEARNLFEQDKDEVLSLIAVASESNTNPFLTRLKEQIEKLKIFTPHQIGQGIIGKRQMFTRDSMASSQGIRLPPHLSLLAEVVALENAFEECGKLAKIASQGARHFDAMKQGGGMPKKNGQNIFIGHGRSPVWKDLKDFIQDRLQLPWDEFNRVPVAGVTNTERLSQMLNQAAVAFLVLTAEDEQADGTLRARENVVHEAGLFQGRLGFTKAILLLENGCAEFSNIVGLGQIRFPKGNISTAFEEIRRVLEREGVVEE